MKIPINIGIEIEYFITNGNIVYNASKELEKLLGFSIDQNNNDSGQIVFDKSGYDGLIDKQLVLRTDGTVCEAQIYYNNTSKINLSEDVWKKLNKFKILDRDKYNRCFIPYLANNEEGLLYGEKTIFDSPGVVHSSGKMIRNAYDKTCRYPDKKEDELNGKLVSFRTAGVHIHFSLHCCNDELKALNHRVFCTNNYTHTDNLVKIFDDTYKIMFNYYENKTAFRAVNLRQEKYQKFGDYRLKFNTISGSPTLEYRQLPSNHINITSFINTCKVEMNRYLLSI